MYETLQSILQMSPTWLEATETLACRRVHFLIMKNTLNKLLTSGLFSTKNALHFLRYVKRGYSMFVI